MLNGHANGSVNGYHHGPGPDPDRLPPQNLEAEQGVLGSILLDSSILPDVLEILEAEDFYRDTHQAIYRAIRDQYHQGRPVDTIMLADELQRRDQYRAVGSDGGLGEILGSVPHAANGKYYAQIVRQKALSRRLIEASGETLRDAYSDSFTAADLLRRSTDRLSGLADATATLGADAPDEPVAHLGDVRRVVSEARWLWPGWIVDSHMTVLASDPGVGKTRLALDLCRRMWLALPWPDGELATRPPRTPSLWVASDRHHAELAHAAREYGLPDEAVFLNARPEDPCGGLRLDDPHDVAALARRVRAVRPGLLIVDTINKATRRLLYRPEEADAFFGPLLDIARDCKVALLALTHLSKGGEPLDRRIEGTCRVMWKIEAPDPTQPERLRLWVEKTNAIRPGPLGVTMSAEGSTYDRNPPAPVADRAVAEPRANGRPPTTLVQAIDWLRDHLADGPALCRPTFDRAEQAGHAKRTLWRAVRALGVVQEGPHGNQYFRLPADGRPEPDDEDDFDGGNERFR